MIGVFQNAQMKLAHNCLSAQNWLDPQLATTAAECHLQPFDSQVKMMLKIGLTFRSLDTPYGLTHCILTAQRNRLALTSSAV